MTKKKIGTERQRGLRGGGRDTMTTRLNPWYVLGPKYFSFFILFYFAM
jgi:hypothetical protein